MNGKNSTYLLKSLQRIKSVALIYVKRITRNRSGKRKQWISPRNTIYMKLEITNHIFMVSSNLICAEINSRKNILGRQSHQTASKYMKILNHQKMKAFKTREQEITYISKRSRGNIKGKWKWKRWNQQTTQHKTF